MTAARRIDWDEVRARIARQRAALEDAFAGRGPWADELLRRRAVQLAGDADDRRTADALTVLVARGAATTYALEVRHLARILPLPRVAPVPGAPPELLGLIAAGGRVMRLFDVDRLCGGESDADGSGFAVTLRGGERPAALRLATVEAVRSLPAADLRPVDGGRLIRAVTEERVALLDVAAVLERIGAAGER
ncbi:chemotaxis protein CheW [Azospirillum sp.]|uniref:chemotaxis protein CheW n=1 Tax=Azospirillum sp. TaxID=34012 RepID=UPI003D704EE1